MRIKRYFASDMRTAMSQVKSEQGPDAVILSNKRVDGGIEIVAATDYDPELVPGAIPDSPKKTKTPADIYGEIASTEDTDKPETADSVATEAIEAAESAVPPRVQPIEWSQEPNMVRMREEISVVRELLESQLAGLTWNHLGRYEPFRAKLLRDLTALGLDASLTKSLVDSMPTGLQGEKLWQMALGHLAKRTPFVESDLIEDGGIVAVVGPTGVGKTTTVAKLATRFALRHGTESVGLITTDGFRIGAQEQLLTFGKILGIPIQAVSNPGDLTEALEELSDRRLVLIDTAGMSQRDEHLMDQLAVLATENINVSVLLALSANTQLTTLYETIRCFRRAVPLAGTIITKIDEATSLGGVFSAVIRYSLPIAYATDGQRVPEDIRSAAGYCPTLISMAVSLMKQHAEVVDEEYMAEEFARVANYA